MNKIQQEEMKYEDYWNITFSSEKLDYAQNLYINFKDFPDILALRNISVQSLKNKGYDVKEGDEMKYHENYWNITFSSEKLDYAQNLYINFKVFPNILGGIFRFLKNKGYDVKEGEEMKYGDYLSEASVNFKAS